MKKLYYYILFNKNIYIIYFYIIKIINKLTIFKN